jgi:hypothetical protein
MATLAEFTTALTAFHASPSETTKRAVMVARAALPDAVSGEGGTVNLPNIATLEASLAAALQGAAKTSATGKRFIRTGVSHG